jgi:glucokinase
MPKGPPNTCSLIADVGGTHARFAVIGGGDTIPRQEKTLSTIEFHGLAEAVEYYLAQLGSVTVSEAAIAIANPVTGDRIKMTNHHWTFSIEETRRRLCFERLLVLNDFTALALALPTLAPAELRQVGGGAPAAGAPYALIGPGTGLGMSGLFPLSSGEWLPIAGEGGHVTLCAVDEREANIIAVCREEHGHVSAERLLSGMGLTNLYRAIARLAGAAPRSLAPAEVTRLGLAGDDSFCREALDVFCAMLGTVAGNLALTLGARGGLYIGGGIVPKIGDYFHHSRFRGRFESKGRFMDYLAAVPTYVIHAPNAALQGAAAALRGGRTNPNKPAQAHAIDAA